MTTAASQVVPPRPMLAREGWLDLCGPWQFAVDDDDRGLADNWFTRSDPFDREIQVPFPPESKLSQVHDTGMHPVVWYRRTVDIQATDTGRLVLHFGAVDYDARVWINGQQVTHHEGGHTPFEVDITDQLVTGPQIITVRAEDHPDALDQPRGKQDWQPEPHSVWYHRTTGIWQPVWIETVYPTHIQTLHWTPDITYGRVDVEIMLSRHPEPGTHLHVELDLDGKPLGAIRLLCAGQRVRASVDIPAAGNDQDLDGLLWSPESPALIGARLTLSQFGTEQDRVGSYFGFRSVGTDRGEFLLNDRPYRLRMVLEQGYWPQSMLAAPTVDAHRQEVEQIKELGFNAARIHQKIEDPRFLYWCDRLGLAVWTEMPSSYTFSPRAVARTTTEWMSVIDRDRSHPSIIAWVPMNESWGVRWIAQRADQQSYVTALYHLTKALDPTRPVVSNDGWEHTRSDLLTLHDYAATGTELTARYGTPAALQSSVDGWGAGRYRTTIGPPGPASAAPASPERDVTPVLLTEFGGIGLTAAPHSTEMMYSSAATAADYLDRLAALVDAVDASPGLAGFCYTQLTDTEQETNGLLTADRQPKAPVEHIRAVITGRPRTEQS